MSEPKPSSSNPFGSILDKLVTGLTGAAMVVMSVPLVRFSASLVFANRWGIGMPQNSPEAIAGAAQSAAAGVATIAGWMSPLSFFAGVAGVVVSAGLFFVGLNLISDAFEQPQPERPGKEVRCRPEEIKM